MNHPLHQVLPKDLKPKKKFGQNFLTDESVLNKIADSASIVPTSCVVEIGPGTGLLTNHLLQRARKVLAYEIDADLVRLLSDRYRNDSKLVLKRQDVLLAKLEEDCLDVFGKDANVLVVANLPYYITTPIIMKLLTSNVMFQSITIMMQKEVARRVCASPKSKDYGYLSVVCQYHGKTRVLFDVGREAFVPSPDVESSIVQITPHQINPYTPGSEAFFIQFLKAAFHQKRKTLSNNLERLGVSKKAIQEILIQQGLSTKARGEELSVAELLDLSNHLEMLFR